MSLGVFEMFDCGIDVIIGEIQTQFENDCVKAVQSYGFNINKEQLKKVITDSKSFYDDGYNDARLKYERPQGKWIKQDIYNICSYCGSAIEEDIYKIFIIQRAFNFCPNCGAKMVGVENE